METTSIKNVTAAQLYNYVANIDFFIMFIDNLVDCTARSVIDWCYFIANLISPSATNMIVLNVFH